MKSLKRLQEEQRIREEKKAEKERIKAEKERLKKEEKRKKHKQRLRKKQNKRAYDKRRQEILDKREKNGDFYSYHMVVIMKNNKRIKRIGASWWKTDAFNIYNEAIEKNREEVKFPIKFTESFNDGNINKVKYEILIVQRRKDDDNISQFRNEDGEFVDNIIVDNKDYIIIAKNEWLIEETFNVYGYHPKKDRKTFDFILNNMLLKNNDKEHIKRLFIYNNRLVIQYDDDFDFITCKNSAEVERLYNELYKILNKNKFILFTGHLNKNLSTSFLNKLEEKTGWSRETCKRIHAL